MSQVQLVHFTPNPFSDEKYAVAAYIDGTSLVRDTHKTPAFFRSVEAFDLLERTLERLETTDVASFRDVVGRQFSLGQKVDIENPTAWLKDFVFTTTAREQGSRRRPRKEVGKLFLRREQVQARIDESFRPEGRLYRRDMQQLGLENLSLYAVSNHSCLLIEPLDPNRRQFQDDVHKVARRFRAYDSFFRTAGSYTLMPLDELIESARCERDERDPDQADPLITRASFISFVLPGANQQQLEFADAMGELVQLHAASSRPDELAQLKRALNDFGETQAA